MNPSILDNVGPSELSRPHVQEPMVDDPSSIKCDISIRIECDSDAESVIRDEIESLFNSIRIFSSVNVIPVEGETGCFVVLICIIYEEIKKNREIAHDESTERFRNEISNRIAGSLTNCLKAREMSDTYSVIQIYKGNCFSADNEKPIYHDVSISKTPLAVRALAEKIKEIIF